MIKELEHATAWVCVDCYSAHNGISEDERGEKYPAETLALMGDAVVTAGLLAEEYAADCTAFADGVFTGDECNCERKDFSWSACEGCGSTLGGEREALTLWFAPQDEGSASLLLLAGFLPVVLVVVFLAHLLGAMTAAVQS